MTDVWTPGVRNGEVTLHPDPDESVLVTRDRRYYDLLRRLPAEYVRELQKQGILKLEPEESTPRPEPASLDYRTH